MNVIKCYYKDKGVLHRIDADPEACPTYEDAIHAVKTMLKQENVGFNVRRRVLAVVASHVVI